MNTTASALADGYVVDVDYIHSYLAGLMPLNLALAAAAGGVRPPDVDGSFAYLDLGCGNGFTPALIAAAYPRAEVWGNDFNPAHIRNACATAAAAGLANAHFVDASFAEMLDRDLPRFDMIAIHGIWSWVGQENRDTIAVLLDRLLKPGGLAMISYNCHPGWDALLPLRRLLVAAAGTDGTSTERIGRALATARALRDAGADMFRNVPAAGTTLDHLLRADPHYVAHEYLNAHCAVFEPREVFDAVAPAGLAYVGQAGIFDDLDAMWLTAEQRALVDAAPDRPAAQAMRDVILDRRFRRDLFVRGGEAIETARWLSDRRFALARPRGECAPTLDTRVGEIALPPLTGTLLDALAERPATAEALRAASGASAEVVRDVLLLLAGAGHIQPALHDEDEAARAAATGRFNAAMLARARMGEPVPALASPVTGSGVKVDAGEQLLLDALAMGIPLAAIDGSERFVAERLPFLRILGVA